GSGKSRTAWPCLEKAITQGLGFFFVDNSILKMIVLNPYDNTHLKDKCFTSDLLFWDDYGNDSDSPGVEDLVWDITKYRNERGKKMLITTQYTSDTLAAKFRSPERGLSIVRRLKESCVEVNFNK
ncbi:MAG TPA: hypothetical protein PKD57_14720, partial [Saprospiraceae bacterium]|nr:hypothetical protein [Saprospiraceae bacterium]